VVSHNKAGYETRLSEGGRLTSHFNKNDIQPGSTWLIHEAEPIHYFVTELLGGWKHSQVEEKKNEGLDTKTAHQMGPSGERSHIPLPKVLLSQ